MKGGQGKVTEGGGVGVCVCVSWGGTERGKGHGEEEMIPEVLALIGFPAGCLGLSNVQLAEKKEKGKISRN